MKIVGLTGPSGAGKSELCRIAGKYGIPSLNADEVYHFLLFPGSPCVSAIAERFGDGVLAKDGGLDRAALAKIVFSDENKAALADLNAITHSFVIPKMLDELKKLEKSGADAVICDVPLLFESGFDKKCDFTVAVLADRETRVKRVIERDKISEIAAKNRIFSQKDDEFYSSRADLVILNDGNGLGSLEKGAETLINLIKGGKK